MHSNAHFQSRDTQRDSDWGWYEEDIQPRHCLKSDSRRYLDRGLGPRSARPVFDPQPAVHCA